MKQKLLVSTMALIACLGVRVTYADHSFPAGSTNALLYETRELVQVVSYSPLRYQVKDSVFRFSYSVERVADCIRSGGIFRPIPNDHLNDTVIPARCSSAIDEARRSFYNVDRYLWDTSWDLPQVYRVYLQVRDTIRRMRVQGGF